VSWFRKVKAGLVKSEITEFVGEIGNVFFNIDTGEFRLSDGVTPGGIPIMGGSGGPLPIASATVLGGIKVGSNLTIAPDGTLSAPAPFSGNYSDLIGAPPQLSVETVDSNNDIVASFSATSILSFDLDSSFSITQLMPGNLKISLDSNLSTIRVSGQDDLTSLKILNFVAGTGITLQTNNDPLNTTLTINSTAVAEDDVTYAKRINFITDNLLYRGEAAPGALTSDPVWRIRRITIESDNDVTEEWAGGNSNFDKVWDNHLALSYS
jgi:hypothetical protein